MLPSLSGGKGRLCLVTVGSWQLSNRSHFPWRSMTSTRFTERWIEIKRLPDRSLVTVIEILSPTNKIGSGRAEYIEKRKEWIRQPIHLVEIDLLLGGQRLPMGGRLPRQITSRLYREPPVGRSVMSMLGRFVGPCR